MWPTLITVGSFLRRVRSTFCSFVQQLECSKHIRTRNVRATLKAIKENQRPELQKHTKDPPLATLVFLTQIFFGTMRLFF